VGPSLPAWVCSRKADCLSHGAQKVSLFAGLTVGLSRFRHPMETPATAAASSAGTEAPNTVLRHTRKGSGGR
jgi:hypothetical protein